jgi:HlyD family secretion protein
VGNSALNRAGQGGISTNTAGAQEAKDFKVVVTLDEPPPELRPGLSCTATIVTATRKQVLTVPIQALTIREFDPDAPAPSPAQTSGGSGVALAASQEVKKTENKKKIEKEGVFVIKDGVAFFRAVKTGITGTTDIEILEGLSENEQIVTGTYQVLRTLKDNTRIKIETTPTPTP